MSFHQIDDVTIRAAGSSVVYGDFTGTGLSHNTLTLVGAGDANSLDAFGVTSTHHIVLQGLGGNDTLAEAAGAMTTSRAVPATSRASPPPPGPSAYPGAQAGRAASRLPVWALTPIGYRELSRRPGRRSPDRQRRSQPPLRRGWERHARRRGWGRRDYLVARTRIFLIFDHASDKAFENTAEGTDTVISNLARTLAAGIEILRLTGGNNIAGNGNGLANQLFGNSGKDLLQGFAQQRSALWK